MAIKPAPKALPADDDVFFHKGQVRLGVVLRCYGRRDPNSKWTVAKIHSYEIIKAGTYREKLVGEVQHLSDMLELVRDGSKGKIVKAMRFGAASYSAIWRLK